MNEAKRAGDVCLLLSSGLGPRVVLLLSDATEQSCLVLVLDGYVLNAEPGQTCQLLGLARCLRLL